MSVHQGADFRREIAGDLTSYFDRANLLTRVGAALLLIPAAPILLLMMLVVRCTSSGAAIYRQDRCGVGGRVFQIYKLRTMYIDAESLHGPMWCMRGDSRVTPVGRVLRFLHLDEVPQLINILRGEMAFIGPRPERPEFVTKLADSIPGYMNRLQILPGVTGLAQINLPPDETVDCVRRKLALDCHYIDIATPSLDARIMVCTALRMMGIRHGSAARLMRVKYHVTKDGTIAGIGVRPSTSELHEDKVRQPPVAGRVGTPKRVLAAVGASGEATHEERGEVCEDFHNPEVSRSTRSKGIIRPR